MRQETRALLLRKCQPYLGEAGDVHQKQDCIFLLTIKILFSKEKHELHHFRSMGGLETTGVSSNQTYSQWIAPYPTPFAQ